MASPPGTILCLWLGLVQATLAASLHLSAGDGSNSGSLALYQAPPTYKEPGKPRLNSIIIKSKPYHVNDTTHIYHQAADGKSWRRDVDVTSTTQDIPTATTVQEYTQSTTSTTTMPTTEMQEIQEREDKVTFPQYTIDCTGDKICSETINIETTESPTFRPYTKEELDKYLYQATMTTPSQKEEQRKDEEKPTNKLASIYIEDEAVNVLETTPGPSENSGAGVSVPHQDKSKSWNLVNSQNHKHPYDDRTGWVSLEPIPWSSSQIQKWEPNPHTRPQIPSWHEQNQHRPSPSEHRPTWQKPTYDYSRPYQDYIQKPGWNYNQNSQGPSFSNSGGNWNSPGDIITDGRPGYFPQDKPSSWQEQGSAPSASYHRPTQVIYHKDNYQQQSSQQHHHGHGPGESDGQWVLLSSTKGYSIPQRHRSSFQRAFRFNENSRSGFQRGIKMEDSTGSASDVRPQAMKSHRTVRLTVLPPLNGTTNTTTSHGGLLEVEQTFQTVEEAHREHMAKMMNLAKLEAEKNKSNSTSSGGSSPRAERRISGMKVVPATPMANSNNARNNAVLAAVGAGMIPATMAMLLPMVLGRRKRDVPEPYLFEPFQPTNKDLRLRKPVKKKINLRRKTEVVYY